MHLCMEGKRAIKETTTNKIQIIELDLMRSLQKNKNKRTTYRIWEGMDIKASITRNLDNQSHTKVVWMCGILD